MAWRTYGNGTYYYRQVRDGDSVRSEYVGTGLAGELAAAEDAAERMRQKAQRELERREQRRQNDLDRELATIDDMVRALVAGTMIVTGHRTHKRQWRKRQK